MAEKLAILGVEHSFAGLFGAIVERLRDSVR